jgi:polyisoprenyl-phosphate glycosyltransferase
MPVSLSSRVETDLSVQHHKGQGNGQEKTVEYSVVIPVYRSAETLPELIRRLEKVFQTINESYEIIMVDDASPDRAWQVMKDLYAKSRHLKIIRLQKNRGQHVSILCGMRFARGDYVITIDDDLQNPPEEIPKLIAAIKEDDTLDGVIGIPVEKKHSLYRRIGTDALNMVTTQIFKKDKNLKMASFRILRNRIVTNLVELNIAEPAIGTMLLLLTKRLKNIEVRHDQRANGGSSYSFAKLVNLSINNILNYSALPLQIVSRLGIFFAFSSLMLTIYYLIRSQYVQVSGWSSIVVLITFFSGLILFSLGIIGEYLIRILKAVNAYPLYIISASEGFGEISERD